MNDQAAGGKNGNDGGMISQFASKAMGYAKQASKLFGGRESGQRDDNDGGSVVADSSKMDNSTKASGSGGESADNKDKVPPFLGPTEIEKEVDHKVIEYARHIGVKDEKLLKGLMSIETCRILSQAKLKHRTCK